jgi:hypothetical protein
MSPFDWIGLLPAPPPEGWRDALEAQAHANARLDAATAQREAATAHLATLVADPTTDPATVRAAALDLLVSRETGALLPPAPAVDPRYADEALAQIRAWFANHPTGLGAPPLILAERRHALEMHQGQLAPDRTDNERQALPYFANAATELLKTRRTVALLTRDLKGEDIATRVQAFGAYRSTYEDSLAMFSQVRELVDAVDAARLASDELHRCPLWSGSHCAPLLSLEAWQSATWSEGLAMEDGLPARAATGPAAPVLVGA